MYDLSSAIFLVGLLEFYTTKFYIMMVEDVNPAFPLRASIQLYHLALCPGQIH